MENLVDDLESNEVKTRPVFLTVLCILTFVGAGFGVLAGAVGFFTIGMMRDSMELANELGRGIYEEIGMNMDAMYDWQIYANIANFSGALLCLIGALLMWKLKKVGFYLYVPGAFIPVIVGALAMQYIMTGLMAGFGMLGIVINVLISGGFVVMYGLNFKHLK